jgi:hypothetical protein
MITSQISQEDEIFKNLNLTNTSSEIKFLSKTLDWPSLTVSFFSFEKHLRK